MRLWLLLRDMVPLPVWKWEKRVPLEFYSRTRIWRTLFLEAKQGKEVARKIQLMIAEPQERRTAVNVLRPRSR